MKALAYLVLILAIAVMTNVVHHMFVPIRYIEPVEFISTYWFDYSITGALLLLAIALGSITFNKP